MLSCNVTKLTDARMRTNLDSALEQRADVVTLQETAHVDGRCRWAERISAKAGWRTAWSASPPRLQNRSRGYGGTAILWSPNLGRSTGPSSLSHRDGARSFPSCVISSPYGDPQHADVVWFANVQGEAEGLAHGRPIILAGDCNWRPVHDRTL